MKLRGNNENRSMLIQVYWHWNPNWYFVWCTKGFNLYLLVLLYLPLQVNQTSFTIQTAAVPLQSYSILLSKHTFYCSSDSTGLSLNKRHFACIALWKASDHSWTSFHRFEYMTDWLKPVDCRHVPTVPRNRQSIGLPENLGKSLENAKNSISAEKFLEFEMHITPRRKWYQPNEIV